MSIRVATFNVEDLFARYRFREGFDPADGNGFGINNLAFALKNLLIHRKLSTTERYTHLVQHKIAQASELVADAFNDSSTK